MRGAKIGRGKWSSLDLTDGQLITLHRLWKSQREIDDPLAPASIDQFVSWLQNLDWPQRVYSEEERELLSRYRTLTGGDIPVRFRVEQLLASGPMTRIQLAQQSGRDEGVISTMLQRLRRDGKVRRLPQRMWELLKEAE